MARKGSVSGRTSYSKYTFVLSSSGSDLASLKQSCAHFTRKVGMDGTGERLRKVKLCAIFSGLCKGPELCALWSYEAGGDPKKPRIYL